MDNILSNPKPDKIIYEMKKNKKDFYFWFGGIAFITFVFIFISSKEFSFLLVASSLVQMLSFLIVLIKVYSSQSVSGLSVNTFKAYFLIILSRLASTIFYLGYLPEDSAGDWFYQLNEFASLILIALNVYFISVLFRDTAESEDLDSVDYKYLALPALLLALLVHASLNDNLLTDVCWTFSMYLETVAIYPQLSIFQRKKGVVENYTSHYVSLQGLSRFLSLVFWFYTYEELNTESETSFSFFHTYTGYFIIASQVIQLVIMCDYYYYYFKSIISGEKMSVHASYDI